jgi:tRNA pseudouridine38-40 synthase
LAPVFRLVLEYDGAAFAGWQVQPDRETVQGVLEVAIARVAGCRVRVVGAGRTDAGVHAEGQVASAAIETELAAERLRLALNGVLPPTLAVVEAAVAPPGFHARRDARSKRYRYCIWNGATRSPLRSPRAWCLQRPLDLPEMRRAAAALVGTHDFASFQTAGSDVATSLRTLHCIEVEGASGAEIRIGFEGSGFLRHMVRNLTGTLVEVGSGRRRADEMPGLLAACDRRRAGRTAPAHGLTLEWVRYDPEASPSGAGADGASEPAAGTNPAADRPLA